MSYLSMGEKHGIQGGGNARGEKVSGGRKCVSHSNYCITIRGEVRRVGWTIALWIEIRKKANNILQLIYISIKNGFPLFIF